MAKNELKSIERLAMKYLRGEDISKSKLAKEAKKYANRLSKYKSESGSKRVSASAKEALHFVTASEFLNGKKIDFFKNLNEFEGRYGKPSSEDVRALKHVSANELARRKGLSVKSPSVSSAKSSSPEEASASLTSQDEFDKMFSTPELGTVSWYALPMAFRASRNWPHKSGSFMYNNALFFWTGNQIDLDALVSSGVNGYDHDLAEFFGLFVSKMRPDIIFMGASDEIFYTTRSEWESKTELSPDFLKTRKYR